MDKIKEFFNSYLVFFYHLHFPQIRREVFSFFSTFFGGFLLVTSFILVILSGLILMYFYVPDSHMAWDSVRLIEEQMRYGSMIRSVHTLSAQLMVFSLIIHLVSLIYRGACTYTKRFNWFIGMGLLILTVFASYTGYLLPFNQLGYWAITVGANMVGSAPLLGDFFKSLFLGGNTITSLTLLRFYVHHCMTLTIFLIILLGIHLYRIRKDKGLTLPNHPNTSKSLVKSQPWLIAFEVLGTVIISGLITIIAFFKPIPLGPAANELVTPNPMKAPWYLIGLQEMLHYNHPFLVSYIIPGCILLFLFFLPYVYERWKPVKIENLTLPMKLIVYSLFVMFMIAALFFSYHVNWTIIIFSFLAIVCIRFVHNKIVYQLFGKMSIISFFLIFIIVTYAILTVIALYFRGPNWKFTL